MDLFSSSDDVGLGEEWICSSSEDIAIADWIEVGECNRWDVKEDGMRREKDKLDEEVPFLTYRCI